MEKSRNDLEVGTFQPKFKKRIFASLIKTALETFFKDTVKNGFRAGGLYPFGPSYKDMTKIKSRKIPQAEDLTLQNQFLENLEKEIKSCLSADKLKLFKELYYKARHELDEKLPNEDISLYLIWARVKHSDGGPIRDGDELSGNTPEILDTGMVEDAIPDPILNSETKSTDKLRPDQGSLNSAQKEHNAAETPSCEDQNINNIQSALPQLLQNEPGTSYTLSNQSSKNSFVESADNNIPNHMLHKTPEKDKSNDTNMLNQP